MRGHRLHDAYRRGAPFPRIAIDDDFPESVVDQVLDLFPGPKALEWRWFENARERKLAASKP